MSGSGASALARGAGVQRLWGVAVPRVGAGGTSVGAGVLTVVAMLALFIDVTGTVGEGEDVRRDLYCDAFGPGAALGTWLLWPTGALAASAP